MSDSLLPQQITSPAQALVLIDRLSTMLQEAQTLSDFVDVRDKAEAFRTLAQAAKIGLEMQNHAAELKLRAERRAGEYLASQVHPGGDQRARSHRATLKLEDLEITKQQSYRWRQVASIPEAEFEQYVAAHKRLGIELSGRGLRRYATSLQPSRATLRRRKLAKSTRNGSISEDGDFIWELTTELREHHRLLQQLLLPLCDQSRSLLKPAEQRHIRQLFKEIDQVLRQLAPDQGSRL